MGKNGDVQAALDRLASLTNQEDLLVSATTLSVTNEILGKVSDGMRGMNNLVFRCKNHC